MVYRKFSDLRAQVEAELDTQGEEFITDTEMRSYFNSAITLCEATIVKLGLREKYLQAESTISTVQGQSDYDLPTDTVINKIRKMVYRNQTIVYTVNPLRPEDSYALEDEYKVLSNTSDEYYNYALYKVGTATKIRLVPTPQLGVTSALRVIYFKSLNRYVDETTACDLPEICYEYLLSYVRYRVYAKESAGAPNTQDEKQNMTALLGLMQETMQNQVADPDMEMIDPDMSHYEEMN